MGFLLSLIFILFFVALFILLAVIGFLRSVFSFRWLRKGPNSDNNQSYQQQQQKQKTKVFDDSEGEYTDFEEIK